MLGRLAPVVIRAKLLIQTAWLQRLDWDASLASEEITSLSGNSSKRNEPYWWRSAYHAGFALTYPTSQVVRAVKHHFRRFISETTLTYEEMAILLAEVALTRGHCRPYLRISMH